MEDLQDGHGDHFAALVAELDRERMIIAAAVGAANDLALDLRHALLELKDALHKLYREVRYANGEEVQQVRLEIRIAELALGTLSRISDALAAADASRS